MSLAEAGHWYKNNSAISVYFLAKIVQLTFQDSRQIFERRKTKNATFTIAIAAETGSLTPRTVHTSELSEPAGIIPIGIDIPSFWLSLLSRPLTTYK